MANFENIKRGTPAQRMIGRLPIVREERDFLATLVHYSSLTDMLEALARCCDERDSALAEDGLWATRRIILLAASERAKSAGV